MTGTDLLAKFSQRLSRWQVDVHVGTRDALEYFAWADRRGGGSEAATLCFGDHILLYFRSEQPTASAVLEEIAHVMQQRHGHFAEAPVRELEIRRELEVHACLDERGERLGLHEDERRQTRLLLARDTKELRELGLES